MSGSIKWKTFAFDGDIASFDPSRNAVSIMFHRGTEIPGKHPKLGRWQARPHDALPRPGRGRGGGRRPGTCDPSVVRLEVRRLSPMARRKLQIRPPGLKPTTKVGTLGPYRGRLGLAWVIAPLVAGVVIMVAGYVALFR